MCLFLMFHLVKSNFVKIFQRDMNKSTSLVFLLVFLKRMEDKILNLEDKYFWKNTPAEDTFKHLGESKNIFFDKDNYHTEIAMIYSNFSHSY